LGEKIQVGAGDLLPRAEIRHKDWSKVLSLSSIFGMLDYLCFTDDEAIAGWIEI
jgi:hypothetical protein